MSICASLLCYQHVNVRLIAAGSPDAIVNQIQYPNSTAVVGMGEYFSEQKTEVYRLCGQSLVGRTPLDVERTCLIAN